MDTLNLLLAICERGRIQDFEEILRLNHIELCFSLLCRGTASSEILDYLSLERSEKSLSAQLIDPVSTYNLFFAKERSPEWSCTDTNPRCHARG